MRTVKASEVVKGMRVQVSHPSPSSPAVTITVEGVVTDANHKPITSGLRFEDGIERRYDNDHPVTVIAEPEPEWVEGAWYRCQVAMNEPENLRRLPHGWTPFHDTELVFHEDADDITVLGRVLIVDWPGDDVARAIERDMLPDGEYTRTAVAVLELTRDELEAFRDELQNVLLAKVADAIRTQGGAP